MMENTEGFNEMPLPVLLTKIKSILASANDPKHSNSEPGLLMAVGILIQANEEKIIQALENQLERDKAAERVKALHKYNFSPEEAKKLTKGFCLVINGVVFRDEPSEAGEPIITELTAKDMITEWLDIAIDALGIHTGQSHTSPGWTQTEDRWEIINLQTCQVDYQGMGDSALPELLKD